MPTMQYYFMHHASGDTSTLSVTGSIILTVAILALFAIVAYVAYKYL